MGHRWGALCCAIVLLCAPLGQGAATGATLPEGFQDTAVLTGLTYPTTFAVAKDGRVLVAEKSGIIKIFGGFGDTTPAVFADLRTQVHNFWDRGLLGMALDPDFPDVPHVYVLYTYDALPGGVAPQWGQPGGTADPCPTPPGATADGCVVQGRLSRLVAAGDVAVGEEQVLLTDWCQQYPSHSLGSVAFGPDGALYVGAGDGASFNWVDYGQGGIPKNPCGDPPGGVGGAQAPPAAEGGALRAQDVRTQADVTGYDGAILRLDPATGAAMPDNPLIGGDPSDDRIIAYGLRNPFRFSVRPGTSEIWIGDVGWSTWEEIDRIADPADAVVENFGWPCYEGGAPQPGYAGAGLALCASLYAAPGSVAPPFHAWQHKKDVVPAAPCGPLDKGSSAGNIAFYSGGTWPAEYKGALFFTDYNRGCIWGMWPDGSGEPDPGQVFTFAGPIPKAVELKTGPGGDLFYVDYEGGAVRRIRYFAENAPPIAAIGAAPTSGPVPLEVAFDASGSTDANPADVLQFAWDLDGDGAFDDATGETATFTYESPGVWTPAVRVTDVAGASDVATVEITADETPPLATVIEPAAGATFRVGDVIAFVGAGEDLQDGALPADAFAWTIIQHHCDGDCHQHVVETLEGVTEGSFVAPDHEYPSHLELSLTVTDSAGLQASASVVLMPQTVTLTFETDPPALTLAVGATAGAAPLEREVIVGSSNSVSAPSPQALGGVVWKLEGWSDGGEPSHQVVAPDAPLTLAATFVAACGDGVVDPDEACDPAAPGAVCCAADCTAESHVPCEDGEVCTVGDRCHAGACVSGAWEKCRDGNRCTDDLCVPGAGCAYVPNAVPCSDGSACTVGDACGDGACVAGPPARCDDGNPCTVDLCSAAAGCKNIPRKLPCDDGDPCTAHDRCSRGACAGTPIVCDDGDHCTLDACTAGAGCVHTPNPACGG